jgi:hypothetical protein
MDFATLKTKVAEAQIGRSRLTDLKKGTYTLALDPDPKVENVYLVSEKKVKTPISINSLAGMRVVTSVDGMATIVTTADARENADKVGTLQNMVANEGFAISETTKFNIVHHLRIKETGTDAFVYKNEHYKNYADYVKTSRKIAALPGDTKPERDAKAIAFTEASEALRSGGLKSTATLEDKNLILMPVFTVTN